MDHTSGMTRQSDRIKWLQSAGAKHDFRRVTLGGVPKGFGKIPDFSSFSEREECPLESVL